MAEKTGSTQRTADDPPREVHGDGPQAPTAGQLRAAGYEVPEGIADDQVATAYRADTVRTDPEPLLVRVDSDELIHKDKTPAEAAGTPDGTDIKGIAPPESVLMTTVAEEAKRQSKGSAAEKQGPPPKAEILSETPTEAAQG